MLGGFDYAVILRSAPFIWGGILLTLQLTALAIIGGLLLGMVIALMRLYWTAVWAKPSLSTSACGAVNRCSAV